MKPQGQAGRPGILLMEPSAAVASCLSGHSVGWGGEGQQRLGARGLLFHPRTALCDRVLVCSWATAEAQVVAMA